MAVPVGKVVNDAAGLPAPRCPGRALADVGGNVLGGEASVVAVGEVVHVGRVEIAGRERLRLEARSDEPAHEVFVLVAVGREVLVVAPPTLMKCSRRAYTAPARCFSFSGLCGVMA